MSNPGQAENVMICVCYLDFSDIEDNWKVSKGHDLVVAAVVTRTPNFILM
jgi:hypothetical protein